MTKSSIAIGIMWVVVIACWIIGIVSLIQPSGKLLDTYPKVTVAPEDLNRLENEAYKVCAAYANLDLSEMVTMCKLVHYQQ